MVLFRGPRRRTSRRPGGAAAPGGYDAHSADEWSGDLRSLGYEGPPDPHLSRRVIDLICPRRCKRRFSSGCGLGFVESGAAIGQHLLALGRQLEDVAILGDVAFADEIVDLVQPVG